MEKEKKLFFCGLRKEYVKLRKKDGDVPDYKIDEFKNYLLRHAKGRSHLDDCDRNYILYLETFVIPEGAVKGKHKKQGKNQFRSNLAKQLSKFIVWKNPPTEAPTVEVSPNVHHHVMIFV